MKRSAALFLLVGWLIGAGSFWSFATLSGGWYDYGILAEPICHVDSYPSHPLGRAEIVPNQPNPCHFRTPRFTLP